MAVYRTVSPSLPPEDVQAGNVPQLRCTRERAAEDTEALEKLISPQHVWSLVMDMDGDIGDGSKIP